LSGEQRGEEDIISRYGNVDEQLKRSDRGTAQKAEELLAAERKRFNDIMEMLPAYLILLTQTCAIRPGNCALAFVGRN